MAANPSDAPRPQLLSDTVRLVACVGQLDAWQCQDLIYLCSARSGGSYLFVLASLLHPFEYGLVDVLLVCDCHTGRESVMSWLQKKVPILVPVTNHSLPELCRKMRCGLFFANPAEGKAMLDFLSSEAGKQRLWNADAATVK